MHGIDYHLPVMGIALILAFIAGKFSSFFKVPKVTAYILVGLVLGPSGFNLVTEEIADGLEALKQLAFGLILFNIGGEFHRGLFKKITWLHVKFAVLAGFLVFTIVSAIMMIFGFFTEMTLPHIIAFSTFLGVVATAAAPPTTVLVMKEYEAKGPLSDSILVFLALGTVLSIVGSALMVVIYKYVGIWSNGTDSTVIMEILKIIWKVGGSFIVGMILGFILSYWEQREKSESELLVAVLCGILLAQTLSFYLGLDSLLVSLFIGFALVNTSSIGEEIHQRMKGMGLTIYALFFVLAGAHVHLKEQMATIGVLGIGYILARTSALLIGSRLGAKLVDESPHVGKWMGVGVQSHAGAAIAIVTQLKGIGTLSSESIISVVLASVIFYEILGPFLLKMAIIKSGEAKSGQQEGDVLSKSTEPIKDLFLDFIHNLNLIQIHHIGGKDIVRSLIDKSNFAITSKAKYHDVIKFIDGHHFPIYPVVDDNHHYLGCIEEDHVHETQQDHFTAELTLAGRIISFSDYLPDTASYEEALAMFEQTKLKFLPVVNDDNKRLLGVLSYKTLTVEMKKSIANQQVTD